MIGRGILSKVHVVPEAPFNLCSISQCMEQGWTLGGNKGEGIWLKKNGNTLKFDIRLDTAEGVVWCACLKRVFSENSSVGTAVKQLSIQHAHYFLGHMGQANTSAVAKDLGWQLTRGSLHNCEDCAIGKGRQKNVPKIAGGPIATLENPRANLDCCTLRVKDSFAGKKTWRLIVL
jgi:hypothetical protein